MSHLLKLSTSQIFEQFPYDIRLKPLPSPKFSDDDNFSLSDSYQEWEKNFESPTKKSTSQQQILVIEFLDQILRI